MLGCCFDAKDIWKDFSCKVEDNDKGITVTITGDDPKKVEALKTMLKSAKELCSDNCCC
ncbi:MAG: hypothetical protein ACE5D6_08475 [Candidatus Zixiibacteriota bacterium]